MLKPSSRYMNKKKMPNFKGGKKYKAGKGGNEIVEVLDILWDQGQMPGRVIKVLGDRNMMVYCNDNLERVCHIRGGLRKKNCMIDVGDVVLISIRSEGMRTSEGSSQLKGDILDKFARETHRMLKKDDKINARLFVNVEQMDARQRANQEDMGEEDIGFIIEHGSDTEEGDEDEDEEDGKTPEERKAARAKKQESANKKRQDQIKSKEAAKKGDGGDSDVDIDRI
jgi:translation initiation factor 1A